MFFNFSLLLFLILFGFQLPASADTLYLKNGRSIEGLIKKEDADNVDLEISFGSMKFSTKQIDRIARSSPKEAELIRREWADEKIKVQQRAKEAELRREHEPKEVSVDKQSGHVKVTTTLNNKIKANLILDTGASLVILSNKIANKLGVDVNDQSAHPIEMILADGRKVEAKMIFLESVSVQDSEVKNIEAAILPEKESAAIPEDGLLGMSFLKKFNFKIDQKNDKLILEKL
ncbi:MAG: retroviral-like aspartic protease family protein [Candidatus Omnitrophica bacterium]|nr:retroviral-like aspartic protease family protein [Candidatus Omnitrophota bacterium]MBU1923638.1 retroviral-like aspartic protease family protein [Candidatus Omnitrophota bacterium]